MPFSAFADYPLLTLFGVIVAAMFLMSVLSPRQRTGRRVCRRCGVNHPDCAAFCRRCGRPLNG
jgi:predicted amidophosphoribosyltransferase